MGSIQKRIHGSGIKLIIEQEDLKDIMKIIEALENSAILLKGVSKTIENETKEQRGRFLSMLLGTLGASLLGNLLTGGKGIMRAGDGIVRAGEGSGSKKKTKFTITLNLDEYKNTCTHWVALFVKPNEVIYFDSFGVEHIPKEINKFIGNSDTTKSSSLERIKSNIFRIQAYDSMMRGYFCMEFINYMLKDKTLLDNTNLFSPNDFKKNDRVVKRIFKNE